MRWLWWRHPPQPSPIYTTALVPQIYAPPSPLHIVGNQAFCLKRMVICWSISCPLDNWQLNLLCILVNPPLLIFLIFCISDMWLQYKSNRGRGKPFTFTMNLFQDELAPVILPLIYVLFLTTILQIVSLMLSYHVRRVLLTWSWCHAPSWATDMHGTANSICVGQGRTTPWGPAAFLQRPTYHCANICMCYICGRRTRQCRWLRTHLVCLVSVCSNTSCSCGKFAPHTWWTTRWVSVERTSSCRLTSRSSGTSRNTIVAAPLLLTSGYLALWTRRQHLVSATWSLSRIAGQWRWFQSFSVSCCPAR